MKNLFLSLFLVIIGITISAQEPSGYYNGTEGLTGNNLKLALRNIIDNHTIISYDNLWDAYYYTDKKSNGKVWDMYSNCSFTFYSDQCGSYSSVCDCYNREHTVPKSWFNEASPMVSDLFQVVPTDGKVNGQRSNYPYGECNSGESWGTGKLGTSTYSGYSGTVFEPADDYKGDIARIYFYMATRYNVSSWSGESFSGDGFSTWTKNMLLEWHYADPVSQKEIDRNNIIYTNYQHNRNPYVDHPEWACLVFSSDCPTATNEISNDFSIYPNPAENFVNIEISNVFSVTTIKIIDITGKIVFETDKAMSLNAIDVSRLKTGVYLVEVRNEVSVKRQKLIIK